MKLVGEQSLQKLFKLFQKYKYLILVIGIGILLIVWPKSTEKSPEGTQSEYLAFSVGEMEKELTETLSKMEGVGSVRVMLTLKADMEVRYLEDIDEKTRTEWENGQVVSQESESKGKTVLSGQSGTGGPVVIQRVYPIYQGALIVCEGADNASIQLRIKEAVSGLTGLSGAAVTVSKMTGGE